MRPPLGLAGESEEWVRDGVITDDQRRAILARYEPDAGAREASAVLTWLAVIVAGIGAVVLVAWNWTSIQPAVKLLITAGPMSGLYVGAAAAARARREGLGEAFALLAALLAGAVLFVADDLVHVDSGRTSMLLVWAAVLAATAILTPSAVIAGVAMVVSAWWLVVHGDLPPAGWWVLAIWAAVALTVERVPNRWAASGAGLLFGVSVFFVVLDTWNDRPAVAAIATVLAGNWLYTLSLAPLPRRPAFTRTTPALVITLLGLIFLLPSGTHATIGDWRLASDRVWPAVVLMIALAAGVFWNTARGTWRSRSVGLTAIVLLWLAAWFLLPESMRATRIAQWTWTAVFSGAMVHLGAAAVRDAARVRDIGQLAAGLAAILIFVLVRVADARSLAMSGLMLIGSALLLLWLARLWVHAADAGARA